MHLSRRAFTSSLAAGAAFPTVSLAAKGDHELSLLMALVDGPPDNFLAAMDEVKKDKRLDLASALITAMRFSSASESYFNDMLTEITGETAHDTWFEWMLWQERNPQIVPQQESLIKFKRGLLLRIDPNFDVLLKPAHLRRNRMKIRLEEITWGGVRKDGIPSLDNPTLLDASKAGYMRPDDLVFGVSINGDTRAYPLRIMGWHEMFNETIGGVPVALAYCTLCGSGILFETKVKGRNKPLVFGSSGFLYRSNKLMFDRATHSLWNQFTGKPVSGKLVNSGIELKQRPVVITTWRDWRKSNPDTRVLSQQTGFNRNYGSGVVYQQYFASKELMFPTNVDQSKHFQKDYVFGIREFGGAKAWPLKAFGNGKVINDQINGKSVVLIGDASKRQVRAFERADIQFTRGKGRLLKSPDGREWRVTEEALVASDSATLPRVAGHIAYWFAWNGYLGAESELYQG